MSQFNIDEIEKRTLSGLKDFQRATVERVDYLFRHNQNRVLVADEVGMGKTLIARGAIVKTARLRIEEKDDLFKVIYICSNQNIANQNIRKLNVTGKNAIGSVSDTRLSMQHLKITEQENDPQIKEGFIQLIEFAADNKRLGQVLYALAHSSLRPEFSIEYTVADVEKCKNELLHKAIEDSIQKAQVLTTAANVKLGEIQAIDYSWGEIDFVTKPLNEMRLMECTECEMSAPGAYDIDIEADDINVTDTATVIWEIA